MKLLYSIAIGVWLVIGACAIAGCRGCNEPPYKPDPPEGYSHKIINGCDYVVYRTNGRPESPVTMTHSGSCPNPIHKALK